MAVIGVGRLTTSCTLDVILVAALVVVLPEGQGTSNRSTQTIKLESFTYCRLTGQTGPGHFRCPKRLILSRRNFRVV